MLGINRNRQSESLVRFGLSESDVERLIQALAHADLQTRRAVRAALRELGEAAAPALARAAHGDDPAVRGEAGELLRVFPVKERWCAPR